MSSSLASPKPEVNATELRGAYLIAAQRPPICPVVITARTCEAAGFPPWRVTRKIAKKYGVPEYGDGRTKWIVIADLLKAMEAANLVAPEPPPPTPIEDLPAADQEVAMLAQLGLRRVAR